ncbi:MAG: metallophosphoesterase [Peptococcaceae bacterium]|nr:metallophosphoesterase [Peptococcaceae bacterium]
MRIGLLSDTHELLDTAYRAIEAMGPIDLLIHAGDYYRDAAKIAAAVNVPVHAVVGNCDSRNEGPEEKILEVEGAVLFITHGHRYNVKISIYSLFSRAVELKADVVIYGHTHIPGYGHTRVAGYSKEEGLLIINPGSISRPREEGRHSYGILEINGGVIKPAIFYL